MVISTPAPAQVTILGTECFNILLVKIVDDEDLIMSKDVKTRKKEESNEEDPFCLRENSWIMSRWWDSGGIQGRKMSQE